MCKGWIRGPANYSLPFDAMMKYLRAIVRLVALAAVTAGYYLLLLAGKPFALSVNDGRRRWRNWNFRGWARRCSAIMGLRINRRGDAPVAPFLLVANHLSYVDILVLAAQLECVFIAKHEVAGWPILGLVSRAVNTIFINRGQKRDLVQALAKLEAAVNSGLGVALFAEGTSTNGS